MPSFSSFLARASPTPGNWVSGVFQVISMGALSFPGKIFFIVPQLFGGVKAKNGVAAKIGALYNTEVYSFEKSDCLVRPMDFLTIPGVVVVSCNSCYTFL